MAKTSQTIAKDQTGAEIPTTPLQMFSVQSDRGVSVQAKNTLANRWHILNCSCVRNDGASIYIATSDTIRINNTSGAQANVEIFTP